MNQTVSANKAGLVFGGVLALSHFSWAVLIALGWAQPLMDFIVWLHMIKQFVVVEPFNLVRAAGLVIVTGLIGYVVGTVSAALWNRIHR